MPVSTMQSPMRLALAQINAQRPEAFKLGYHAFTELCRAGKFEFARYCLPTGAERGIFDVDPVGLERYLKGGQRDDRPA